MKTNSLKRTVAAGLICTFWTCWGPYPDAGSASDYIGFQKTEVQKSAYVIPDGNGFDVFLLLQGPEPQNKTCTAVSAVLPTQPDVGLCAGSSSELERNDTVNITHKTLN